VPVRLTQVPRHDRRAEEESEEVIAASVRALLEGIVDYAGLFPPASLDMRTAVEHFASYRGDGDAWTLGRFVLPVSRLSEFEEARRAVGAGTEVARWSLSGLTGGDAVTDIARVTEFNVRQGTGAVVESLEAKLSTADDIRRVSSRLPGDMELYVEIPVRDDPLPLVRVIADAGAKAKIRTGGVTADAFPSSQEIARFLRRCVEAGAPFKATAGLHHPIRAPYRLTYDADAPHSVMFGFLNVFVAAAVLRDGGTEADAIEILETRDARQFRFDDDGLGWRDHRLTTEQLRATRRGFARSFGSCSFREPVDDLRALALI
jgi:hypothetical protein